MSARSKPVEKKDHFAFYMDMLGHDVLNNNQAVLSYLELIAASPSEDKNIRAFAEKAVSHVRTSTVLIDNVKRLIAARTIKPDQLRPADLVQSIQSAEAELKRHFPAKKIKVETADLPKSAMAFGNNFAADLVLNIFVAAVRLNPGDDIALRVALVKDTFKGRPAWVMKVEDKDARLPKFVDEKGVLATYSQDVSTAGKTTGMLFAKMLAESLGGDFEARSLYHDPAKRGAQFTMTLRMVEKP